MSKSDEIDRRRMAAYAWRLLKPGDALPDIDDDEDEDAGANAAATASFGEDLEPTSIEGDEDGEDDEGEDDDTPDGTRDDAQASAHEACAALADGVDAAWELPEAEQAEAVAPLLMRAQELAVRLCAMQRYPKQSVRLLRLAIRCRDELSDEANEAAQAAVLWLDYNHPEVVDLLVEVSIADDQAIAIGLQMALHGTRGRVVARIPGASARLARLLDEGPDFPARRLAIDWLRFAGVRSAKPALRRALRMPHFGLRYRALELLEDKAPEAITAEDLVFLVEDAEVHPPPEFLGDEENSQANCCFPELLERAIVRVRPPGAAEPLERISASGRSSRFFRTGGLDASWALRVLAAAFPQKALARIDMLQRRVEWDRREQAVEAAGCLPDELAWPRLLVASADGVPEIADEAQQIWLNRRGQLCPRNELAGVEIALLESAPSERMRSRLSVLRRASLAARAAMVEVLLGEAPDPEALVLVLFAASDSGLWERKPRPGLPESRKDYCRAIVSRFGARGVEGIVAVATRYPGGRYDWLHGLSELLKVGQIPEAAFPAVRALAAQRIQGDEPGFDALAVLARVGAPLGLAERIWSLAHDRTKASYVREEAADALASLIGGDARFDETVVAAMSEALAAADLRRFECAALVGLRRAIPAAIDLTERALAEHQDARPDDPAVTRTLEACVDELQRLGRLARDWTLAALGRPGTYAFCVAARRSRSEATQEALAALAAALTSSDPSTAAEAAIALLRQRAIDEQAEELRAIAARVPLVLRSELVSMLLYGDVPARLLWPMVAEILVSEDREVTEPQIASLYGLARSEARDDLRALAPRVVDPVLRRELTLSFEQEEQARYWHDVEREEEEDE